MTRINTNVPSLIAQQRLNRSGNELELRLERLSTGLRINRGKDDPAGLIISERHAPPTIKGVEQGIKNGERASSRHLHHRGFALSEDQRPAQLHQVARSSKRPTPALSERCGTQRATSSRSTPPSSPSHRISNTASFGGLKLLNGALDYVTSGLTTSTIQKAEIFGASFIGTETIDVGVDVIASAQKGALFLTGDNATGTDGVLVSTVTLRIKGPDGVREIQFLSGTAFADIVTAVNNNSELTGVEAALINGDATSGLVFRATDYGSGSFVSVERVDKPNDPDDDNFNLFKYASNVDQSNSDPFDWSNTNLVQATRDEGRDVQALINGVLATGKGLNVSINSPTLALDLLLNEEFATDPSLGSKTFQITGGGAQFQLGPDVNALQQTNIGIQSTRPPSTGRRRWSTANITYLSSLKRRPGQRHPVEVHEAKRLHRPRAACWRSRDRRGLHPPRPTGRLRAQRPRYLTPAVHAVEPSRT
jgi:flagellin